MAEPVGAVAPAARRPRRGPRTLRARLALWICLSTGLSLAIFGLVAFVVVNLEEQSEHDETGLPEDSPADIRNEVLIALAFAAPVGLALSAAGALWITRRTLAPVEQVIEAAQEITAERLDRRLRAPDRGDELSAMVEALNGLLGRLERGYQALSLFAADASHELRTPLAVVASELEVALRRPRSAAEWECSARTSLEEVRRLSRLVDALLRLTRADAAGGEREHLDAGALVEQVVSTHAAAAAEGGLDLVGPSDGGGDAIAIEGDRHALESALSNLIGNAVRYTPRGGRVEVSLTASGQWTAIQVDDTGPGLEPAELEAVFAPFARGAVGRAADRSGGGSLEGLGLGLPIARRIAERHGGRLTAANRAGGGARFRIELPRAG